MSADLIQFGIAVSVHGPEADPAITKLAALLCSSEFFHKSFLVVRGFLIMTRMDSRLRGNDEHPHTIRIPWNLRVTEGAECIFLQKNDKTLSHKDYSARKARKMALKAGFID